MNTLTILVGVPGSGKSTWTRQHLHKDTIVLSSDEIRKELYGYEDQTHNGEVFSIMNARTRDYGKRGLNVIYDATNLVRKRRVALAQEMEKFFSHINVIAFICPIDELLERNITREERHIPEDKLKSMIMSFQLPVIYEFPYNNVEYALTGQETALEATKLDNLINYTQNNKHHSEELGRHILRTMQGCAGYPLAELAAKYHDLGKPFCKTVDEEGYYHFAGHAAVSSYMFISDMLITHGQEWKKHEYIQSVALMIEMHDWIFNFNHDMQAMKEHYNKKYIGLKDKYWTDLEVLTKADRLRP